MTNRHACRKLFSVDQEIVVPRAESVKKLENFLKARFPVGYVRKLFRKHGVRVNGKRSKPEDPIQVGDRIRLYIPFEETVQRRGPAVPTQSKIPTIYEDDSLLVIDKPAGISVHEGKQLLKRHSIIGALERLYRDQGILPKLVHRLDRNTSGVLVVAKDDATAANLERIFAEEKNVRKEYISLLAGRLQDNHGTIDFPLPGRDGKAVRALTRFKIVERFLETTLVKVTIETGRMHQIRLHFSRLGYPVVMDDRHGDFKFNRQFRKNYGLKRQFLHACRLDLKIGDAQRSWSAPLPKDLEAILAALRSAQTGER